MELNLDFKKVDVNNPPPFGETLLLIGVNVDHSRYLCEYNPAIVIGRLESIKKDELVFATSLYGRFKAHEYMKLTDEQSELFDNMVRIEKHK